MQTKTIGRLADNDLQFPNRDISGHHAKVTLLEDASTFIVEDLDSTNGTFVNGHRVEKVKFSIGDELRLSESTIVNLPVLFNLTQNRTAEKAKKEDEKDFTEEFALLENIWLQHKEKRASIQKKHLRRTSLIRASITFAPLIFWEVLQFSYIGHLDPVKDMEKIHFWQNKYIVFSVMGSTLAMLATGYFSPIDKLTALDEEFRVKYVCPNPKCRTQLGNVPWKSYQNQGKCFRCGAKYV